MGGCRSDAWELLRPDDPGYTYDAQVNRFTPRNRYRSRLDRCLPPSSAVPMKADLFASPMPHYLQQGKGSSGSDPLSCLCGSSPAPCHLYCCNAASLRRSGADLAAAEAASGKRTSSPECSMRQHKGDPGGLHPSRCALTVTSLVCRVWCRLKTWEPVNIQLVGQERIKGAAAADFKDFGAHKPILPSDHFGEICSA